MNVALVTYGLDIGGMETYLFSLARALRTIGVNPVFVVTDFVGRWHHIAAEDGFEVLCEIPRSWESRHGHAVRLGKKLGRFDVVMMNHCRPAQCAASTLPPSTVAVSVLHGSSPPIYHLGLANAVAVDAIVSVSDGVMAGAASRGMIPGKLRRINNGIEVLPEYPEKSLQDHLRLVFLGRLHDEQKGIFLLPEILSRLGEMGIQVRLDVVGDGQDAEALKRRLAKHQDIVFFHGALPHDEAMQVLTSADAMLFPSYHEGLSIVLLEAMSQGVIPVASRLAGVTDIVVDHGVDGFLAPVGEVDAFADAIAALADRGLREQMSRAAWSKALTRFSVDRMARQYLDLIEECRDKRRCGVAPRRSGKVDDRLLGKRCRVPLLFHNISWKIRAMLGRRKA